MKSRHHATANKPLVAAVLALYYLGRKKQLVIAADLGVSVATINRILAYARDHKLVEITLKLPEDEVLAGKLLPFFHKSVSNPVVIVVPLSGVKDAAAKLTAVGRAGAACLERALHSGSTLAIDGGDSVAKVIESMQTIVPNLKLYAVAGGPLTDTTTSVTAMIGRFMGKYGPDAGLSAEVLGGPVADVRKALARQHRIALRREAARGADVFLLGVGAVSNIKSSDTAADLLRELEIEPNTLLKKGIVGVSGYSTFDEKGVPIPSAFDKRVIKVEPEYILGAARSGARRVIVVARGLEKVAAISAMLRGGWATDLVTDDETARAILAKVGERVWT